MSAPRRTVHVVATGVANLASVRAALARLGCEAQATRCAQTVRDAAAVVLPGVGAFGVAAENLAAAGLVEALRARVRSDRPLLAICLGMQLLTEGSEESAGVEGLGVVPGRVERFRREPNLRVPQFGWNRVERARRGGLLGETGHAYFANSYRLGTAPAGWDVAWAEHGGRFVAALERGAILACQFHPELSSQFGHRLMGRWLGTAFASSATDTAS